MNQNQKRILMVVIGVVFAMLIYPPFQIVHNKGLVFNMGYNWIIEPPQESNVAATVNVSMLLIQWIGVLIVGSLAFFLAKTDTQESKVSGSGVIMFGLLRLIRGFCGFVYVMQFFGLYPVLTWLQQPDAVTGGMWAQALIKVLTLVLFGWLFFWLRSIINSLHTKKHGVPHPALAEKKWAL